MPTYIWRCETCKTTSETVQDREDRTIPRCATCGKRLLRVYAPIPFIFRSGGTGAQFGG